MSKWINTLSYAAGLCIFQSPILGWGNYANYASNETPESAAPIGFPFNADQEWFVKESYLIMKPYEEDVDYASKLHVDGTLGGPLSIRMKPEKPEFEWYSGVRLGLGKYLPNHDAWDMTFYATYFYAQETDHSSPDRSQGGLLTPLWIPTFTGAATNSSVVWRLNYFTWDLSAGREFNLIDTIMAHPYIGLRAAVINKHYAAKYFDHFNPSPNLDRKIDHRFSSSNDYWGIGPRLGSDFWLRFTSGWAFVGSLSGAVFYGQFDVKEKFIEHTINIGSESNIRTRARDSRYCVRANLEGSLGLGWEAWVRNHTVRVAPSILFETSVWYDTNDLFTLARATTTNSTILAPPTEHNRHQGDLTLMGFSFNLQIDF